MSSVCPSESTLLAFLDGTLSPAEKDALDAHVGGCDSCARLVALSISEEDAPPTLPATELAPPIDISASPRPDDSGGAIDPASLRSGKRIGRYIVLAPIGAGGIGIVYSAFDPQLGRQVALKLLRPEKNLGEAASARLLREAQAMARLKHPNVVTVYDVGTWREQVFIAMELISGGTLASWRAKKPRSWREIVRVFAEAGEGLAAAHEAGLIHRDFKPENVLIDESGRARVTDFGLARVGREAPSDPLGVSVDTQRAIDEVAPDRSPLTITGALIGSPAYMAPEQMRAGEVDARSDVFSFCVALHEALAGERPFAGETLAALREQIERRRSRELPREVPAFLRKLLARGLSPIPAERPRDMRALLESLRQGMQSRARPLWIGALALLLLGVAAAAWHVVWARERNPERLCPSQAPRLAAVWSPARRTALENGFASLALHDGLDQVLTAERGLDAYGDSWRRASEDACRAAKVRHEQTEAVYQRRARCFDQRLEELGSLIALLTGSADRATLLRSQAAVASLAPVSSCDDTPALRESEPPPEPENDSPKSQASPESAARAVRLAEARQGYAEARALASVGAFQRSFERLAPVAQAARELKYAALESEALLLLGRDADHLGRYPEAERLLRDAAISAELARRDDLAAKAFSQLIYVSGNDLDHVDEALRWADFAQQAIDRAGGGVDLRSWREQHLGSVLANHKRAAEALPHLKAALELAIENNGNNPDAPELGTPTEAYACGLALAHRYEEALPPMRRALELMLRKWPKTHPNVAEVESNLADTLFLAGHLTEAETYARDALEAAVTTLGQDNEATANAEEELSQILREEGRTAESLGFARQALEVCVKHQRCNEHSTGDSWHVLGAALLASGARDEARTALEEGLTLRKKSQSDDLPETQLLLAKLLWETPAQQPRARALALEAKSGSQPDDPRLAKIDTWLTEHPEPVAAK